MSFVRLLVRFVNKYLAFDEKLDTFQEIRGKFERNIRGNIMSLPIPASRIYKLGSCLIPCGETSSM